LVQKVKSIYHNACCNFSGIVCRASRNVKIKVSYKAQFKKKCFKVSDLYQKLRTLENAVEAFCLTDPITSSKSKSFFTEKELTTILQNVNDLNQVHYI